MFEILKKEKNKTKFFLVILIIFLPISLLSRSSIYSIWVISIDILFLYYIYVEKKFYLLQNNFLYILLFFWISLIINLFFTIDFTNSFLRAIGFGRFIIFIFAVQYCLTSDNYKYENIIFKTWFIIFCVVTFDLIFESIFGFNTLGFRSYWDRRLASFLNLELKIGHYYYAFAFISLSYFITIVKNKYYHFSLFLFFLFISYLIGERSNFIKMFLIFIFFTLLYNYKNLIKKLFLFIFLAIVIIFISSSNIKFKERYIDNFFKPIYSYGLIYYLQNSQYGAHYYTAIAIFKNYPYFGVGLRNFRNESPKEKYKNDFAYNDVRIATHPHQIHLEFLSETGFFGYLCFLLFVMYSFYICAKNYIIYKNNYQLSALLFFTVTLLPIIPSGSFFVPFGATIFWTNFAIMISYQKKNKNK